MNLPMHNKLIEIKRSAWRYGLLASAVAAIVAVSLYASANAQERTAKFVPDRPGRVYIFAGFDAACQATGPVTVTIIAEPKQGAISLRDGQETRIAAPPGPCVGTRIRGTGVYYTARAGANGTDTFAVHAKLASGEEATKTFTVEIDGE